MQVQPNIQDLLLSPELNAKQVETLLSPYGFKDTKKADANLQFIAQDPRDRTLLASILKAALEAFSESADPDLALNNFERFTQTAFSKTSLISYLNESIPTLFRAAKVFGGSPFLSDVLIRNPEYFYWVFDTVTLKNPSTKTALRQELHAALSFSKRKTRQLDLLRVFKRKEILRIGVRDLIQIASVQETLREVSNLADVLIEQAHKICERALRQKYGKPSFSKNGKKNAQNKAPLSGFTVVALGKLGSRELNFSSDVDLIYVYDSRDGETVHKNGPSGIRNAEYYERLAKGITAALNASTGEGYVYRVDLRLRPEGEMGLITQALESYRRYYQKRGATWERMVLLRARPVSGDRQLAQAFLTLTTPFIYEKPCGQDELQDIWDFKEKIDEVVATRKQSKLDVKRGFGGIREIEFIVQTLQLRYGRNHLELHGQGTMNLLKQLAAKSLLTRETASALRKAYLFLRNVENKLQMRNDHQTHLLPTSPVEMAALAIRLGYSETKAESPSEQLKRDCTFHAKKVHAAYTSLFQQQANH